MSEPIRAAYSNWPQYNAAFHDVVEQLTDEQLGTQPSSDRWPLWATIGHAACQRVFWLCVFLGAPGEADTPFPNSGFNCPGDDDLDTVWSGTQLAEALDSTFRVIDWCLDNWTVESLADVITHKEDPRSYTRGSLVQRVFAHDLTHIAELNETLSRLGLAQVDIWD